jgi:excisionase family DNA binding protein
MNEEKLLSTKQVAKRFGVSRKTVRRWVLSKRLKEIELSPHTRRFRESDLPGGLADEPEKEEAAK